MNRKGAILIGVAALALMGAGGVVASALNDLPQDATPVQDLGAARDITADLNRQQAAAAAAAVQETAPEAEPAPRAPVPITTPVPAQTLDIAAGTLDLELEEEEAPPVPQKAIEEPEVPLRRQRLRIAVVEAVDKVTAQRMRFEVPVGGRPVRFDKALIFRARACEVSTPDEPVQDSIAYLEVSVQPRGVLNLADPREVFQGWMFASSPAVSGLEHPLYDAWVVGCRA